MRWAPKYGPVSQTFSYMKLSSTLITHRESVQTLESQSLSREKSYPSDRNDCDLAVNHKKDSHDRASCIMASSESCQVGSFFPLADDVVRIVWCPTSACVDGYSGRGVLAESGGSPGPELQKELLCIFGTSLRFPDGGRGNVPYNTVNDRVNIINGLSSTCVSYTAHHLHHLI